MSESSPRKPLRVWPGVVAAVPLILLRFVVPVIAPDAMLYALLGAVVAAAIIVVWWLFFSRAPWIERIGALALMVLGVWLSSFVVDISIRTGMMGNMLLAFSIFLIPLALVAWASLTRRMSDSRRRALFAVTVLLTCGSLALLRTDGISGAGAQLKWRWTKTA